MKVFDISNPTFNIENIKIQESTADEDVGLVIYKDKNTNKYMSISLKNVRCKDILIKDDEIFLELYIDSDKFYSLSDISSRLLSICSKDIKFIWKEFVRNDMQEIPIEIIDEEGDEFTEEIEDEDDEKEIKNSASFIICLNITDKLKEIKKKDILDIRIILHSMYERSKRNYAKFKISTLVIK